jgi:hypothetical protein
MATASAAFGVLKKGFAVGRDIESMASDLSRWMGALSDLDMLEKEAKNPPIFKKLFNGKSVEQEAIEASIRKQRQETLYKQRQRRQKFVEIVAWMMMAVFGAASISLFVLFLKGQAASAVGEMVTCRKVKCEKLDNKQTVCVFKGANNTIETQFFKYMEFIPKEYQCKYDPKAKKEMTIQETLKEIRESQK